MKKLIIGIASASCLLMACNNKSSTTATGTDSTTSNSNKIKQIALNSDLAFNNKDAEAVYKDCSSDFVDYGTAGESKPMKNIDSMKTNLKQLFVAFPDFKVENLYAIAQGDTVMVLGDWSGTFKSEYMKIKPTGKSFKLTDVDVYTFNKDGKINSHKSIQSETKILYQLGIPMPPPKKNK